ncbi:MAG TPA: hypothetical protein VGC57_15725 [Cellulomonas sp.]
MGTTLRTGQVDSGDFRDVVPRLVDSLDSANDPATFVTAVEENLQQETDQAIRRATESVLLPPTPPGIDRAGVPPGVDPDAWRRLLAEDRRADARRPSTSELTWVLPGGPLRPPRATPRTSAGSSRG